jgi:hypothetical protein
MSIFYADGFEHYGTGATGEANMLRRNFASNSGGTPQGTNKRTGNYAWGALDNPGSGARVTFPGPKDVVGIALALWVDKLPSSEGLDSGPALQFMRISDTFNAEMCSLSCATTGAIRVRRADGTVIFNSPANVLAANTWNHVEAKFSFAGESGALEVRVNEVTVIDISDVDLGEAATAEQFSWADRAGAQGFDNWYIDDLVLWDDEGTENNDFLGDVSVFLQMPNADTAQADWTKSTGSVGYVIIDDVPPDADFLEASVAGDRSDFEMPTFAVGNVAAVLAVLRFSLVAKASAGSATFRQGIVSNAVEAVGAIHSPTTQPGYYNDVFQVNPDGDIPWDVPTIEDLQITIEKVT